MLGQLDQIIKNNEKIGWIELVAMSTRVAKTPHVVSNCYKEFQIVSNCVIDNDDLLAIPSYFHERQDTSLLQAVKYFLLFRYVAKPFNIYIFPRASNRNDTLRRFQCQVSDAIIHFGPF